MCVAEQPELCRSELDVVIAAVTCVDRVIVRGKLVVARISALVSPFAFRLSKLDQSRIYLST